ncbi:cell division protein DIVIC [Pullulanibacillus pueri]|uniref:Cell division protein DIVIC n=2 Tax=Pullulanibacillus pueri TaxID=1437324 RepID=A0A8J3EP80_9BACL|nr:cell division protein DIVIC [Pullulanibacillus pueri]
MRSTEVTKIRKDYIASREVYDRSLRKRKRNLMKRLIVFGLALFFIIGGFVSVLHKQTSEIHQADAKKDQLEKRLKTVQAQQVDLNKQIKLLHDSDYLGKIARRDYYMSKDGEIIFASPDEDKH